MAGGERLGAVGAALRRRLREPADVEEEGDGEEDEKGDEFYLEILGPGRFKPLMGLIEDRIRICQMVCRGIAEKGVSDDLEHKKIMSSMGFENVKISNSALYTGLRAARSCQSLLESMGGMIIVD